MGSFAADQTIVPQAAAYSAAAAMMLVAFFKGILPILTWTSSEREKLYRRVEHLEKRMETAEAKADKAVERAEACEAREHIQVEEIRGLRAEVAALRSN